MTILTPIHPRATGADHRDLRTGQHLGDMAKEQTQKPKGGCFVAGTLVHTKEGLVPIEKIKVGDWVLSYPDDQQPPDKFREPHEFTYKGDLCLKYAPPAPKSTYIRPKPAATARQGPLLHESACNAYGTSGSSYQIRKACPRLGRVGSPDHATGLHRHREIMPG